MCIRNPHQEIQASRSFKMKKLIHFHVRTELSKSSIALALTAVKYPRAATLSKMNRKTWKKQALKRTENTSGA